MASKKALREKYQAQLYKMKMQERVRYCKALTKLRKRCIKLFREADGC